NAVSARNSLGAAAVGGLITLLPYLGAFIAGKQLNLPTIPLYSVAIILSVIPLYLTWRFAYQAYRINWAKHQADSGHIRGPDEVRAHLHPIYEFDNVVDFKDLLPSSELGPEQIESYRKYMAFVLRGPNVPEQLKGKI